MRILLALVFSFTTVALATGFEIHTRLAPYFSTGQHDLTSQWNWQYGRPMDITWGFYNEGAPIPYNDSGNYWTTGPNRLKEMLDNNYGPSWKSDLFDSSFEAFARVSGLSFTYVEEESPVWQGTRFNGATADIVMGSGIWTGSVAAYAFLPQHGDINFHQLWLSHAPDSFWVESGFVETLIRHEIGHALGLKHVVYPQGAPILLMQTNIRQNKYLSIDEVAGLHYLYGDAHEPPELTAAWNDIGTLGSGTNKFSIGKDILDFRVQYDDYLGYVGDDIEWSLSVDNDKTDFVSVNLNYESAVNNQGQWQEHPHFDADSYNFELLEDTLVEISLAGAGPVVETIDANGEVVHTDYERQLGLGLGLGLLTGQFHLELYSTPENNNINWTGTLAAGSYWLTVYPNLGDGPNLPLAETVQFYHLDVTVVPEPSWLCSTVLLCIVLPGIRGLNSKGLA